MSKKLKEEYLEKYGEISESQEERESLLLSKIPEKYKTTLSSIMEHRKKDKWKTMDFIIYLVPKATPRPRATRHGVFYVSGAKDNKNFFRELMENKEYESINTACKFYCDSYIPTPSSFNRIDKYLAEKKLIRPISKPDWDNLGKTYSDMIQGILLLDDSLIIEGCSRKFYSLKPRIEIHIEYMESYDSKINEKRVMEKLKTLRK